MKATKSVYIVIVSISKHVSEMIHIGVPISWLGFQDINFILWINVQMQFGRLCYNLKLLLSRSAAHFHDNGAAADQYFTDNLT